jgi:hypothetical protein
MTDTTTIERVGDNFQVTGPMEPAIKKIPAQTARGLKGHRPTKGAVVLKSSEAVVPTVDKLAQLKAEIARLEAAVPSEEAAKAAEEAERYRKAYHPTAEEIEARNQEFFAAERARKGQTAPKARPTGSAVLHVIKRIIPAGQKLDPTSIVTIHVAQPPFNGTKNAARWATLKDGATVQQALEGCTSGDLRYWFERAWISIEGLKSFEPK